MVLMFIIVFCCQTEAEIGDCSAPDSSLSSCVVSLETEALVCAGHWCRFPSKHDWDAAQFVAADDTLCGAGDTISLQYWHICYDCLLGSDEEEILEVERAIINFYFPALQQVELSTAKLPRLDSTQHRDKNKKELNIFTIREGNKVEIEQGN